MQPYRIAGAKGGVEVYKSEPFDLHKGDKVRFSRNDPRSGLVNGEFATVESPGMANHSTGFCDFASLRAE